jgi:hypothetical protein
MPYFSSRAHEALQFSILKTNVAFIGSLLSGLLIEPLYLSSIVVGMNSSLPESATVIEFNEGLQTKEYLDSLWKSLYGRICDLSSQLQSPFKVNLVRNLKLLIWF